MIIFHFTKTGGDILKDSEIVEILKKENDEFQKIEEEHRSFEQTLAALDKRKYHTTDEEMERKTIQKKKLLIKDRMAVMIREYKKTH
jgi:uncharacterized protein YdcH (DUF465 family)